MQTDRTADCGKPKWLPGIILASGLLALLLLPCLAAAGDTDEEEPDYGGSWVAELGSVPDLNEGEPVLVKAVFRDEEGTIMDIEKVYVRWEWINKASGRWIVLSAIDTYMKCLVEYIPDEGIFRDPCYGSEYDLDGHVTKKPAKDDLPDYSEMIIQEGKETVIYADPVIPADKTAELKLLREPEE
jgi:Rieske Fe-S protein